jgi:hypothetical protein
VNVQELWRSSDSVVNAIRMSFPCWVLRVVEHELVEFGHPTPPDPSTANEVGPAALTELIRPNGTSPPSRASTIINGARIRLLNILLGINPKFLTE